MIKVKSQLSEKDQKQLWITLQELTDLYGDFYITKNNLRLSIKENTDLLFENLKKGDILILGDEEGIAYIGGFADNSPRKYIKILSKTEEDAERLIKIAFQNVKCDLFAKVKKNNPVKLALQRNRFKFAGDRGKEILLVWKCPSKEDKHVN